MSQSQFSITALSTVEEILSSNESDLKALARIAGVAPEVMYQGADLTGLDLREQDVAFLAGLGTNFEFAVLTREQRQVLERGKAKRAGDARKRNIYQIRVDLIRRFLDDFSEIEQEVPSDSGRMLTRSILQNLLLKPIVARRSLKPSSHFGADYMSAALRELEPWVGYDMGPFFMDLFVLFGKVQCAVDGGVIPALAEIYLKAFAEDFVVLLAKMRPTETLDKWWIFDAAVEHPPIERAIALAEQRLLHLSAVEAFIIGARRVEEIIELLGVADMVIDSNQAERLAFHITQAKWPPRETKSVLNAPRDARLRSALFRQLLVQGDEGRIVEIIRWLDDDRGASGALSLENALLHITNFDTIFTLAKELVPRLKRNQISVIDNALGSTAQLPHDIERLRAFRRRYVVESHEWQEYANRPHQR